jgi:oligopeptide/dipeptide ABC transporter ATP-binding protein
MTLADAEPLVLDAQRVTIGYGGAPVVSELDLRVRHGEIVGLIGESGCGKSSVALATMGLLGGAARVTGEHLRVCDTDALAADHKSLAALRGRQVSMIFQEPMTSLNPCMRVGDQVAEVLRIHRLADRRAARDRAVELLELVEIPEPRKRARQYPHELSGGMRQRVMIAIAMAGEPDLLLADEPTTALDVTVQAEILELIRTLQRRTAMGVLLISHDLGVVASMCDVVKVMYAGQVVESGPTADVLGAPRHPYTQALLAAVPRASLQQADRLAAIPGQVSPADRATPGCRFATRCVLAGAGCEQPQQLLPTSDDDVSPGWQVRCWRHSETSASGGTPKPEGPANE